MTNNIDRIEAVRQHFDIRPYPDSPLEWHPRSNPTYLYLHNLITPFYHCQRRVIDSKDKLILDAGCGTGDKSLTLAVANPDAKVIGIDISPATVEKAKSRLEFHGVKNCEFHCLAIENLPELGYQFDYINCDETLYLTPDPALALEVLAKSLKPEGIIRANLHSVLQRQAYYSAQKLFGIMGLMSAAVTDAELEIVVETMESLQDQIFLKRMTWQTKFKEEAGKAGIMANHLLVGDKGFMIADVFALIEQAGLEFYSMVNWQEWNVRSLFKNPQNLPLVWEVGLSESSTMEQLQLYELLNPVHRLLDFWCGLSKGSYPSKLSEWTDTWSDTQWRSALVYLHPQLQTPEFREYLWDCVRLNRTVNLSQHLPIARETITIDCSMAFMLVPLLESPQPIVALAEYSLQVRPIDPLTRQPFAPEVVFKLVQAILSELAGLGYVLLALP